jgi:hypothetical protein
MTSEVPPADLRPSLVVTVLGTLAAGSNQKEKKV